MKLEFIEIKGSWRDVADAARTTVSKSAGSKDPSIVWRKQIILAEHSPIRQLIVKWKWVDLPYWVSTHFVRHKVGIEHWVSTQREDRTGVKRNSRKQTDLVSHECEANVQALINISRKRLCANAAYETTLAWRIMLDELYKLDPIIHECCVQDCVYRGYCYEMKSCEYDKTGSFQEAVKLYRRTK